MASAVGRRRLQKEYISLRKSPVEGIEARPEESNILEWHYVLNGPADSVYAGGVYHGILRFPKGYPYEPPSILMITRNGRFKTNQRLCLSMSDFHPESWNPMWSVSSILSGLFSFMLESKPTLGSLETSDDTKRALAARSLIDNAANPKFRKMFPEYAKRGDAMKQAMVGAAASARTPSGANAINANSNTSKIDRSSMSLLHALGVLLAAALLAYFLCL